MKVLVLGATGFIGHEVARALVRAGHEVVGTTRSAESAKKLEAEEITPKVCDPADSSQWRGAVKQVDVVIDTVGGDNIANIGMSILDTVIEEAKKCRPDGPPLGYIYCSGTWLHGSGASKPISDRTPIDDPMELTRWRLKIENKAVSSISRSFTANVIRPSLLYGGSGSLFAMMFSAARDNGVAEWYGDEGSTMATIHREDLGEAFRLCAEKSYAIPGVIFDISNNHSESLAYILTQLKTVSGAQEVKYKKPSNSFEKALGASIDLRPTLARSLLGWEPRRVPIGTGMEVYYRAWLASA